MSTTASSFWVTESFESAATAGTCAWSEAVSARAAQRGEPVLGKVNGRALPQQLRGDCDDHWHLRGEPYARRRARTVRGGEDGVDVGAVLSLHTVRCSTCPRRPGRR